MMTNEQRDVLIAFFQSTFREVNGLPDQAIAAYVQGNSDKCILEVIQASEALLAAPGALKMLEMLILEYTEIYFVSVGMSPTQWMQSLIDTLKQHISF